MPKKNQETIFFLILIFFFSQIAPSHSSSSSSSDQSTSTEVGIIDYSDAEIASWDWDWKNSGTDWEDFGQCGNQEYQSPTDLDDFVGVCNDAMVLLLKPQSVTTEIYRDSHNNLIMDGNFGEMIASNIDFELLGYKAYQVKFRAPAEHTLEQTSYDMEMQVYMTILDEYDEEGTVNRKNAILAFLFQSSDIYQTNSFLKGIQGEDGEEVVFDLQNLIDDYMEGENQFPFYSYYGSFTEPPCEESVNWYFYASGIPMTKSQLSYYSSLWSKNSTFAGGNGNNRELIDFGSRELRKGNESCQSLFIYFLAFLALFALINYYMFKLL